MYHETLSAALSAAWEGLPEPAREAFGWEARLKLKELRAMQDYAPDLYVRVATFAPARPATSAVKVEVL